MPEHAQRKRAIGGGRKAKPEGEKWARIVFQVPPDLMHMINEAKEIQMRHNMSDYIRYCVDSVSRKVIAERRALDIQAGGHILDSLKANIEMSKVVQNIQDLMNSASDGRKDP